MLPFRGWLAASLGLKVKSDALVRSALCDPDDPGLLSRSLRSGRGIIVSCGTTVDIGRALEPEAPGGRAAFSGGESARFDMRRGLMGWSIVLRAKDWRRGEAIRSLLASPAKIPGKEERRPRGVVDESPHVRSAC
jgi:hypothetical protein